MELIYGIHPVRLALNANRRKFVKLFIQKNKGIPSSGSAISEILKYAESYNLPVSFVSSNALKEVSKNAVHQGICLRASKLQLEQWTENQNEHEIKSPDMKDNVYPQLHVILNEIHDPMNFGAILRSCYYFGVDRIFCNRHKSCGLTPVVSKASSGVMEVIRVYEIIDILNFIRIKKSEGLEILGTVGDSQCKNVFNVSSFKFNKSVILILGSEGTGISNDIAKVCDGFLTLKPACKLLPGIDSLNVSVATGIILHSLSNKKFQVLP